MNSVSGESDFVFVYYIWNLAYYMGDFVIDILFFICLNIWEALVGNGNTLWNKVISVLRKKNDCSD